MQANVNLCKARTVRSATNMQLSQSATKLQRSRLWLTVHCGVQGKDVMAAVSRLHGCDISPAAASAGKKAAAGSAEAGGQQRLWARQLAGEGAHHKKWRIIIRNLSFQVSIFGISAPSCRQASSDVGRSKTCVRASCKRHVQGQSSMKCLTVLQLHKLVTYHSVDLQIDAAELKRQLAKAGFVWDLMIARDARGKRSRCHMSPLLKPCCSLSVGSGKCKSETICAGKPRGFAFASFTCRADAERAIALVNQQAGSYFFPDSHLA